MKKIASKCGTTLVETLVTLALISIMMTMAACSLSSAMRIFIRLQEQQYAQSIVDTVITQLCSITEDASGYVKIYQITQENTKNMQNIVNSTGSSSGNAIEFMNREGYVVLVSSEGCEPTDIYIAENKTGQAAAIPAGQLLIRYYFRNSTDGTYVCMQDGIPVVRALTAAFGSGFYMGNYLEVTYSFPDGVAHGQTSESIVATVTLYRDAQHKEMIAKDSQILTFRDRIIRKDTPTAKQQSKTGQ